MKHPALQARCRIETPLGPLLLAASARGLAGAWFDDQRHHPGEPEVADDASHPHLARAAAAFDAYWTGSVDAFDVALDAAGTPFQHAVWRALLAVPGGTTTSYGAIARAVGNAAAVRAVGAAVGRNPLGIVVPCHRIVGHDGALTGYAGGLDRKRWLLAHEQHHAAAQRALFAEATA